MVDTNNTVADTDNTTVDNVNMSLENTSADPANPQSSEGDEAVSLPYLPCELIGEIALCLVKPIELNSMRLVSKRFKHAVESAFFKSIRDDMVVYPRYACIRNFLLLLDALPVLAVYVRNIVLVAEGLKMHKYGYEWAWEEFQDMENVDFSIQDCIIAETINKHHADDIAFNGQFINGGGYRTMLGMLLGRFPNLQKITVRKLKPGENIPGWGHPNMFKGLSFYHEGLNTNKIFYGDWQYDTLAHRVTVYEDEFGMQVVEPGAGPQATFIDDLLAAKIASGTTATVKFVK